MEGSERAPDDRRLATFDRDRWELYNTDEDPTESHDLTMEHPTKVQEMINLSSRAPRSRSRTRCAA